MRASVLELIESGTRIKILISDLVDVVEGLVQQAPAG